VKNRSVSIAVVMSVALVAVITLLLAVFAIAFYASEKEQRYNQLKHALGVSADQQAAALALPVWNLDAPHVAAILRSGMRHREIQAIAASTDGKTYVQGRDANWQVVTVEREPPPEGLSSTKSWPRGAARSSSSSSCSTRRWWRACTCCCGRRCSSR
jgi:hypothetical protein